MGHNGARPIHYRYAFIAPSNTGIPSGHDLDNDGSVGGGNDAFGFGDFPGHFGMAVLSKYPIDYKHARTFQKFRWADMPDAMLPDDPATDAPADWYSPEELEVVRLSSKSHWDLPIRIGRPDRPLPGVPPDPSGIRRPRGPQRRPQLRRDPVLGRLRLRPRLHVRRPRAPRRPDKGARFVIAGDQNSDPLDGDSVPGAVQQLIDNPRIEDPLPTSDGGPEAAARQGGANLTHESDPLYDTADFADTAPGNLRADYVLPDKRLKVVGAGVFWPVPSDPLSRLTGEFPFPSSDHRSVWLDLRLR